MDLEIANPYVMKIVIAARKEDSARAIAQRIGVSYGWTYRWIQQLIAAGVFTKRGRVLVLNGRSAFYRKALTFVSSVFRDDVRFRYAVLQYFGVRYRFTGPDAVLVWTEGGYNIGRSRDWYPIFIRVKEADRALFAFYEKKVARSSKVWYEPAYEREFVVSFKDGVPVDSLDMTIAFMKKHRANFEPAMEMVQDRYGKRLGVTYQEAGHA